MDGKGVPEMNLTRESRILITICMFDLASTLFFLNTGAASEGNPLMAYYLRAGIWAFILMKMVFIFVPVLIAEWSMQYRPRFVRFMLRTAIVAYIAIYAGLFLIMNVGAQLRL
jgi:hypothetical protein